MAAITSEIKELWPRLSGAGELPLAVAALAGDGSPRRFYRCRLAGGREQILVLPAQADEPGLAEAAAAFAIGRHLRQAGVPVPEIYGFDALTGALLLEDLGDLQLYGRLAAAPAPAEIIALYRQAIEILLTIQIKARPGFPLAACWDTSHYDRRLMLERESGYFYQALGRDWLGWPEPAPELSAEFQLLAELVSRQPADFVLHRDYQCRNLMLQGERLRVIDFQGARLGPLGYDLAALLYDPYAALVDELRQQLLTFYLARAPEYDPAFDRQLFLAGWPLLAIQRHLQMLGAFAFLSRQRRKPFFRRFLRPTAHRLAQLVGEQPQAASLPLLRKLINSLPSCLEKSEKK